MMPWLTNDTTISQIVSLLIAAVLGGLIGMEREREQRPAGLRTYMLVCVGSALFTILSINAFPGVPRDTARVAAQVVTGIGFLGAGTVWRSQDRVSGLTTAAGLWVAAAIGMATGAGMGALALAATVLVLIVLAVFLRLERAFLHHDHQREE
ncbi:MAG TPA: MgtC/SapB family protein [Anaerolineae bacterium]|nr:MgtC/SapB family protein [Anaerolineae bacterium]HNU05863.1 MgtC/SapB family protein [Anaerolineae bacterium]